MSARRLLAGALILLAAGTVGGPSLAVAGSRFSGDSTVTATTATAGARRW